jgi:hypothetical protein
MIKHSAFPKCFYVSDNRPSKELFQALQSLEELSSENKIFKVATRKQLKLMGLDYDVFGTCCTNTILDPLAKPLEVPNTISLETVEDWCGKLEETAAELEDKISLLLEFIPRSESKLKPYRVEDVYDHSLLLLAHYLTQIIAIQQLANATILLSSDDLAKVLASFSTEFLNGSKFPVPANLKGRERELYVLRLLVVNFLTDISNAIYSATAPEHEKLSDFLNFVSGMNEYMQKQQGEDESVNHFEIHISRLDQLSIFDYYYKTNNISRFSTRGVIVNSDRDVEVNIPRIGILHSLETAPVDEEESGIVTEEADTTPPAEEPPPAPEAELLGFTPAAWDNLLRAPQDSLPPVEEAPKGRRGRKPKPTPVVAVVEPTASSNPAIAMMESMMKGQG